jgi:hypothetical protein
MYLSTYIAKKTTKEVVVLIHLHDLYTENTLIHWVIQFIENSYTIDMKQQKTDLDRSYLLLYILR